MKSRIIMRLRSGQIFHRYLHYICTTLRHELLEQHYVEKGEVGETLMIGGGGGEAIKLMLTVVKMCVTKNPRESLRTC